MEKKTFPIWHCSLKAPPRNILATGFIGALNTYLFGESLAPAVKSMKISRIIVAGTCALIFCVTIAGCKKKEPIGGQSCWPNDLGFSADQRGHLQTDGRR